MVKYTYKEFKSVLNKLKYPDSWFWSRYTLNTYSGCAHACIYCDARSKRYYLEDFENEVIIKTNFDKKLDQRLKTARSLLPDVIAPGGVNDAYQPIEKKIDNTRKVLHVIAKYKFPINIATKSKLITRDIDILEKIANNTWCTIGFSISTIHEDLAKFLEPNASEPSERLKALKFIKKEVPNIQVGTFFIPIIPYLTDNNENLEAVFKKSKEAGADFVLFSPGLTLRDSQADYFFNKLRNSKYSHVEKLLKKLYKGEIYPPVDYSSKINLKLWKISQKYGVKVRVKRWVPSDYRKWNYKIAELLLNKEYIDALKTGKSNKTIMWAGLNLNNLKESILDVYQREELHTLKNFNSKVINFIKPYLEKSRELTQKKGLEKFL